MTLQEAGIVNNSTLHFILDIKKSATQISGTEHEIKKHQNPLIIIIPKEIMIEKPSRIIDDKKSKNLIYLSHGNIPIDTNIKQAFFKVPDYYRICLYENFGESMADSL